MKEVNYLVMKMKCDHEDPWSKHPVSMQVGEKLQVGMEKVMDNSLTLF